jgi:hypothetical protein
MYKIPFSVYDFFAYLFSGAIVLAAVDYVGGTGVLIQKDVGLFLGVAFVVFAYVAGQIVAHISSALFEQLFIMRFLSRPRYYSWVISPVGES